MDNEKYEDVSQGQSMVQQTHNQILRGMLIAGEYLMTQSVLYAEFAPLEVRERFRQIAKTMAAAWTEEGRE